MSDPTTENPAREEYNHHLAEVIAGTDHRYPDALKHKDGGSCCCVDADAKQTAKYRFAGGGVRVFLELGKAGFHQQLDQWAQEGGTLKAHLGCGWLLNVKDMESRSAQTQALQDFEAAVNEWNAMNPGKKQFGVEIDWARGTANQFLHD